MKIMPLLVLLGVLSTPEPKPLHTLHSSEQTSIATQALTSSTELPEDAPRNGMRMWLLAP